MVKHGFVHCFFLALFTMFITLILHLIAVSTYTQAWLVFLGVVITLLCCVGGVVFHRIIYEILMSILEIPKIVVTLNRMEQTLAKHEGNRPIPQSYQQTNGNIN